MEIKCTVEELKKLIKETPVAGTTDVKIQLDGKELSKALSSCLENHG